jgi:signal transduction histidine kinase
MRPAGLRSIRARMTLTFAGALSTLVLFSCLGFILLSRRAAVDSADALLHSALSLVVSDLADAPKDMNADELREDIHADRMALRITGPGGQILFQSPAQLAPNWPAGPDWRSETAATHGLRVVLALPWRRTEADLRRQSAQLIELGIIVAAAATLGAWVLIGRTLSPIGKLARQAQQASVEKLSLQLTAPSEDAEIVEVVSTFNRLLSRLTEIAAARSRFHAAASHELRTPLQVLSGRLELALSRDRTAEEYRSAIAEANLYAQKLNALTSDLLLLHQLDAVQAPERSGVDLLHLCDLALDLVGPIAAQKSLSVEVKVPEGSIVQAPHAHAEILVRNLIDNAVKYADDGGRVEITAQTSAGEARLSVYNDHASEAAWPGERLFEPFYRPDSTRFGGPPGTGLGLAICRAIAQTNGWQLGLERVAGGVIATVTFPNAPLPMPGDSPTSLTSH